MHATVNAPQFANPLVGQAIAARELQDQAKLPSVPRAIEALRNSIESTRQIIDALEARLDPVLRGANSGAAQGPNGNQPCTAAACQVTDNITGIGVALDHQNARLHALIQRLEV